MHTNKKVLFLLMQNAIRVLNQAILLRLSGLKRSW